MIFFRLWQWHRDWTRCITCEINNCGRSSAMTWKSMGYVYRRMTYATILKYRPLSHQNTKHPKFTYIGCNSRYRERGSFVPMVFESGNITLMFRLWLCILPKQKKKKKKKKWKKENNSNPKITIVSNVSPH
jgi:hypothetical protein